MLYFGTIAIFALFYYNFGADETGCIPDIVDLQDGFMFSVETLFTLGYAWPSPDAVFPLQDHQCSSVLWLIYLQSFLGIVLDGIFFGTIYQRVSRGSKRGSSIIFSDKAIIRCIRGRMFLMSQVCELRSHQIAEGHVRMYAIVHGREGIECNPSPNAPPLYQSYFMRLNQPGKSIYHSTHPSLPLSNSIVLI